MVSRGIFHHPENWRCSWTEDEPLLSLSDHETSFWSFGNRSPAKLSGCGKTDYLVLWKGYSREEATWVLEQDITLPAVSIIFHSMVATINFGISLLCRYFHSPQPEVRVVLDDVSTFIYNINHSLMWCKSCVFF